MGSEIPSYAIPPVSPAYPIGDRNANPQYLPHQSKNKQSGPDYQRRANNSLYSGRHIDFLA